MPKQSFPISKYEGGLNNEADIRDIEPNEFSVLKNVNVDHIGRLEVIGGVKVVSGITITTVVGLNPGYGIFTFGMDESFGSGGKKFIAIAGTETSTGDFICKIYEDDGTDIPIGDVPTQKLLINDVSTTKDTGTFEPVFTYIDGGLRVVDGNLDNDGSQSGGDNIGSVSQWFGYTENDFFDSTNGADGNGNAIDAFSVEDVELFNPDYNLSDETNTIKAMDTLAELDCTTNGRINILFKEGISPGEWKEGGSIWFYASFVYDNKQESSPTWLYTTLAQWTALAEKGLFIEVYVKPPLHNNRITGMKIYHVTDEQDDSYEFKLLAFVDFAKNTGVRRIQDKQYYPWTDYGSGISKAVTSEIIEKPLTITYETENGYQSYNGGIENGIAKYKTSAIVNRINYIGNVTYKNDSILTDILPLDTIKKYEDAIFKSYVNKFDTFNPDRRLEVIKSDGEQIIKLEEYADRLLQYKEETLYIINISQEIEFLESTHKFRGVTKPYHVYHTEFGIIWANKYGMYLYDGQTIHELLKRQNVRKISMSEWQSFFTDNSSVGYHPDRKKVIIVKDITSADSDCMLFSLDTGAWVYGDSNFISQNDMSNFAINWDREAIWATDNGGRLKKWDDDDANETTRTIDVQTKDFDFGNNSSKNNVYKVIISYTGGGAGTNLNVAYAKDGSLDWDPFVATLNSTSTTQTRVEIEPISIIEDIYSFQLRINGIAHRDFKLNDIEVVYRNKRIH